MPYCLRCKSGAIVVTSADEAWTYFRCYDCGHTWKEPNE